MRENTPEKATVTAPKTPIMTHNDKKIEEKSTDNHSIEANDIEISTKVKHKETMSDDVKMHNFTECCRWGEFVYSCPDNYLWVFPLTEKLFPFYQIF